MEKPAKKNLLSKKSLISLIFGLFLLVLGLFTIFSAWKQVDKVFPFFVEENELYVQFPPELEESSWIKQKAFLSEVFSFTEQQDLLLDLLFRSSGTRKGAFLKNNSLFVYTEGEFYLENTEQYSFLREKQDIYGQTFELVSFERYRDHSSWSLRALKAKQQLLSLLGSTGSIMAVQSEKGSLAGHISLNKTELIVDLQLLTETREEKTSISYSTLPFQAYNSGRIKQLPPFFTQENATILGNLLIQGSLTSGRLQGLQQDADLFSSDYWQFKGKMSEYEANQLIDLFLTYLGEEYPQVVSRELPDDSAIFELKKSKDQFLLPGQSFTPLESGLITYQHGQIRFSYEEDVLSLAQGEPRLALTQSVDNQCYFPSADLNGTITTPIPGNSLWKTYDYALSSQRILLCLSLNEQVIPIEAEENTL